MSHYIGSAVNFNCRLPAVCHCAELDSAQCDTILDVRNIFEKSLKVLEIEVFENQIKLFDSAQYDTARSPTLRSVTLSGVTFFANIFAKTNFLAKLF